MTEKTGWPPGLLQDDDRKLSRWFASRPDARIRVREVVGDIERKAMTERSEALGLANILMYPESEPTWETCVAAAAELRRLHGLLHDADSIIERLQNRIALQEAVMRQALEALQESRPIDPFDLAAHDRIVRAIAALSKALEEK